MLCYLPSSQKGLTLIEASVSAAVVAVSLLGILRLQTQLSKDNADSPVRTAALNAAQQKLEELRAFQRLSSVEKSYANLSCGTDNPMTGTGTGTGTDTPLANATLSRVCTVGTEVNGYKPVTVTVSWTDARGQRQDVRLSSYIAKTDPAKAGELLAALAPPPPPPPAPTEAPTSAPTEAPTSAPASCSITIDVTLRDGNDTISVSNGSCTEKSAKITCTSSVTDGQNITLTSRQTQGQNTTTAIGLVQAKCGEQAAYSFKPRS